MLATKERKLNWAFGLSLLVLAANAFVSYRDLFEQAGHMPLVIQARDILDKIGDVEAALKDTELARRGFLIDGNVADLVAFESEANRVATEVDVLEQLTRSRPDRHPRVIELGQATQTCLLSLRRSITRIEWVGPGGSRRLFEFEPIRRQLATLWGELALIEVAEARHLAELVAERRSTITRAFFTFSVASTLALGTIGTTYTLVRRYFNAREVAERTLREREAQIRLLLDSVGEGIYGIDTNGRCTFCNPAALRLLGYESVEQVRGRDMHQLIHHSRPDGSPFPSRLCPIHETFRSGIEVMGIEDDFYHADGQPIPVEYRAHAIRRDGEILGAVVTFVNIASKRRTETEMRRRDRALRAIGQGVFILDLTRPDHPIVYANAAFERLTGDSERDWSGRNFAVAQSVEFAAAFADLQAVARERREAAVEMLARRKDGSTYWQLLTLAPMEDAQARISHLVGVISDVSERRAAEEKIRESEGRLRLMIESVRDYAIFSVDLAGSISSWNPGAERLFGFTERDILGTSAERLFTVDDQLAGVPAIELARAGGSDQFEAERRQVRADGSSFLASGLTAAVRDEAGTLIGFTKVARDITEPKRVETELRNAKESAESAVRAKSTFLANMGHELRTPLNVIIGYSEMLRDEATDRGMSDLLPDLERIRESGHLLLKLINNVLDLAKIEAGRMEVSNEPIDVADLVRSVVRVTEPLAEKQGNLLQVVYPSDLGHLHADLPKVSQGLSHLLNNAVKFTESGTVIFRVSRERDHDDREWLHFAVADDGIGMTRDQLARLFQPFTQADSSTARRFGGTGLGLTITHRFCQMMGGSIDVSSQPGQGTTFTMKLPVRQTRADEA